MKSVRSVLVSVMALSLVMIGLSASSQGALEVSAAELATALGGQECEPGICKFCEAGLASLNGLTCTGTSCTGPNPLGNYIKRVGTGLLFASCHRHAEPEEPGTCFCIGDGTSNPQLCADNYVCTGQDESGNCTGCGSSVQELRGTVCVTTGHCVGS